MHIHCSDQDFKMGRAKKLYMVIDKSTAWTKAKFILFDKYNLSFKLTVANHRTATFAKCTRKCVTLPNIAPASAVANIMYKDKPSVTQHRHQHLQQDQKQQQNKNLQMIIITMRNKRHAICSQVMALLMEA